LTFVNCFAKSDVRIYFYQVGTVFYFLFSMVLKAQALYRGDCLGIFAPASPVREEYVNRGKKFLSQSGYRFCEGNSLYDRNYHVAGDIEARLADFESLILNPEVGGLVAARGGYGSMALLPRLNFKLIRKHPKIILGFSDITALQMALWHKIGLITFSGPMLAVEERVMYAEQLLERLNDVLCDVQNRIDEQALTLKRLTGNAERGSARLGCRGPRIRDGLRPARPNGTRRCRMRPARSAASLLHHLRASRTAPPLEPAEEGRGSPGCHRTNRNSADTRPSRCV